MQYNSSQPVELWQCESCRNRQPIRILACKKCGTIRAPQKVQSFINDENKMKRWQNIKPACGSVIPGTNIIPTKTPWDGSSNFDLNHFLSKQQENKTPISLMIDLQPFDEFYNKKNLPRSCHFLNIPTKPIPDMQTLNRFRIAVDSMQKDGKFVAVHDFDGVTNSGPLICMYLVVVKKKSLDEAFSMFAKARGIPVFKYESIDALYGDLEPTNPKCGQYQLYPLYPSWEPSARENNQYLKNFVPKKEIEEKGVKRGQKEFKVTLEKLKSLEPVVKETESVVSQKKQVARKLVNPKSESDSSSEDSDEDTPKKPVLTKKKVESSSSEDTPVKPTKKPLPKKQVVSSESSSESEATPVKNKEPIKKTHAKAVLTKKESSSSSDSSDSEPTPVKKIPAKSSDSSSDSSDSEPTPVKKIPAKKVSSSEEDSPIKKVPVKKTPGKPETKPTPHRNAPVKVATTSSSDSESEKETKTIVVSSDDSSQEFVSKKISSDFSSESEKEPEPVKVASPVKAPSPVKVEPVVVAPTTNNKVPIISRNKRKSEIPVLPNKKIAIQPALELEPETPANQISDPFDNEPKRSPIKSAKKTPIKDLLNGIFESENDRFRKVHTVQEVAKELFPEKTPIKDLLKEIFESGNEKDPKKTPTKEERFVEPSPTITPLNVVIVDNEKTPKNLRSISKSSKHVKFNPQDALISPDVVPVPLEADKKRVLEDLDEIQNKKMKMDEVVEVLEPKKTPKKSFEAQQVNEPDFVPEQVQVFKEKTPIKEKKKINTHEILEEMVIEEKKQTPKKRVVVEVEETPVVETQESKPEHSIEKLIIENTPKPVSKENKKAPNTLPTRPVEQKLEFEETAFDPLPELKFASNMVKGATSGDIQFQLSQFQAENSADYKYVVKYVKDLMLPYLKFSGGVAIHAIQDISFQKSAKRLNILGSIFAVKGYHFDATVRVKLLDVKIFAPTVRIHKKQ